MDGSSEVRLTVVRVEPGRDGWAKDDQGVEYYFHEMFRRAGRFPQVGDTIISEQPRHDGQNWSAGFWNGV